MSLINFSNIPTNEISGLDDAGLLWISKESMDRDIYEISEEFLEMLGENEIVEISEDIEEHLKNLEKEGVPKSTQAQMERTSKRFLSFLQDKKLSINISEVPKHILNNYIRYFYSELQTLKDEYYSPASLICFRAALFRYIQSIRNDVNIIVDKEFASSNRMLKTMVYKFKESNQPKKEDTYPAIEFEDMQKLQYYFDRNSPLKLQREIMFNIIYFFLLRGRESLPKLEKKSFVTESDSKGRKYIRIQCEMLTKNAKASLCQKEYEQLQNARMYENQDKCLCPVESFEKYFKLLPKESQTLFPKPKVHISPKEEWYCSNASIGKHTFDSLMPRLSSEAKLSKRYTNHCIRVTAITVLKENGKSNEEIAQFSGHKNHQSVQRYCRKRRDQDREEVSAMLKAGFTDQTTSVSLGKYAKVVVKEREIAASANGLKNENKPQIIFNFEGQFTNCSFNLSG